MKFVYRYFNDGQILRRDILFKFEGELVLESSWYKYDLSDKWTQLN